MLARMKRNWITHRLLVSMQNDKAMLENVCHFLKNPNMHLLYNTAISLLNFYSRK